MTPNTLGLLLCLGVCHFIADYPLSTPKMLAAKAKGSPIDPILCHAMLHAVLMMGMLARFHVAPKVLGYLVLLQLSSHFIIDVLKGKCNVWFPVLTDSTRKPYWNAFGFDQFLHFVVIVIMAWFSRV